MTKEELEALLIEVDMPISVEAELRDSEIKLSIIFANPKDPIKVADAYGKWVGLNKSDSRYSLGRLASSFRKLIEEQRKAGLVPYYSIPSNCTA